MLKAWRNPVPRYGLVAKCALEPNNMHPPVPCGPATIEYTAADGSRYVMCRVCQRYLSRTVPYLKQLG
jgi:hypothetical protein